MVQHDVGGHSKAPSTPSLGQREMDLGRQHIREVVEREGCLVRNDSGLLRPEPSGDQVLVLARREMNEPIDAPTDPQGLSAVQVVDEKLG